MATYLVTGATGFVGGALTRRLLRDPSAQTRVLARDDASAKQLANEGARVFRASLGDPNAIAQAAADCDVVFHCAGESSHRASVRALSWINVAGTENVLNAARHAGVRRLVHVSCADVTLVNRDRTSIKESQMLSEDPLDACARTKLLAEELALQASDAELQVCALRPAWVWGPGDRRALPALYDEARRGGVSLCGNGKNFVPTVYIDNLVEALLCASAAPKAPGRMYHVLDGEMLDAREFLGKLCACLGVSSPVSGVYALAYGAAWLRERSGKPGLSRADVVLRGRSAIFDGVAAVRDLGYQPSVSVDAGMRALTQWVEQQGGAAALSGIERKPASDADAEGLARLADVGASSV
jgi:nucleoside-diphosphate-sugar epimerase